MPTTEKITPKHLAAGDTITETYAAAAARMAAASIVTAERATQLLGDASQLRERCDRIAVALADTRRYDDVAFAFLLDEATIAVEARCAQLLGLDAAWRARA